MHVNHFTFHILKEVLLYRVIANPSNQSLVKLHMYIQKRKLFDVGSQRLSGSLYGFLGDQGPELTFKGTCPFGQSNPKFCLLEKKFNLPHKMLFCTLFIINTVTSYFGWLFSIFMRINSIALGIQFRMTISL